jgi:uncharacterized protein (DUF433 family)
MSEHAREIGTSPRYTIAQAGKLASTSPQNIRRWLFGYEASGHRMAPVFGVREREAMPMVSFLDLCELAVVAAFRKAQHPVKLDRLRKAYTYAQAELGIARPFADERLATRGGHVLLSFEQIAPGPGTLVLDKGGQITLPLPVLETLQRFDYDALEKLATRWFPYGRDVPVVVDPQYGSGLPTIVGRNLRTDFIVGRFAAGEPISALADDYDLEPSTIEAAVRAALPTAA